MSNRYSAFTETFLAFLATHKNTGKELFLSVRPDKGVSGLPAYLSNQSAVSLVLGQRFRNAHITETPTPRLIFETTFNNGPWQTVVIPLEAITFYNIVHHSKPAEGSSQETVEGQWWAVFDGGVQNSPRRPALSEARLDAVSSGLATWVGRDLKIIHPGVTIRHSPTPNDVRIVQTYDGPVTGEVVRGLAFGGKLRDFQAQAKAGPIVMLEPGAGKTRQAFTGCPRAVSLPLDFENRVQDSRDRVMLQMKIQSEALLALYLQRNPGADPASVQIVTKICDETKVIRMYLEPKE